MSEEQRPDGCYCCGAGPQVSHLIRTCVSKATREHFHTSRVEFWKGVRSLVDQHIERMSRAEQKGSTVPVD